MKPSIRVVMTTLMISATSLFTAGCNGGGGLSGLFSGGSGVGDIVSSFFGGSGGSSEGTSQLASAGPDTLLSGGGNLSNTSQLLDTSGGSTGGATGAGDILSEVATLHHPEPASMALFGGGAVGMAWCRRRRQGRRTTP